MVLGKIMYNLASTYGEKPAWVFLLPSSSLSPALARIYWWGVKSLDMNRVLLADAWLCRPFTMWNLQMNNCYCQIQLSQFFLGHSISQDSKIYIEYIVYNKIPSWLYTSNIEHSLHFTLYIWQMVFCFNRQNIYIYVSDLSCGFVLCHMSLFPSFSVL